MPSAVILPCRHADSYGRVRTHNETTTTTLGQMPGSGAWAGTIARCMQPSPPNPACCVRLLSPLSVCCYCGSYGWVGCSQTYTRPEQLDQDYGTPLGLCRETAPGIFERNWTSAHVSLDCNRWKGTITPKQQQ